MKSKTAWVMLLAGLVSLVLISGPALAETVAKPSFNPAPGTYTSVQRVQIATRTPGATIRYTLDGTAPTGSSATYTKPITVEKTVTINAIATKKGMSDSEVASATYTINLAVALPTFSPKAGTYTSTLRVGIFCATAGAKILYTTDGTDPTSSSSVYSSPLTIAETTTIKAKAIKSGMADSAIATAKYTIHPTVARPTFNPKPGTYTSAQNVRISCATAGAKILYTTDGTVPTDSSTVFSSPITVATTTTIKAKAVKEGLADSAVATALFTIKPYVATPTFSPAPGNYASVQNVSLACATEGAIIRFTVNGSTPGATSTIYTAPIGLAETTVVKARAFKKDMTDSPVAAALYVIGAAKVVLLLHDMDAGPGVWNDLVMGAGYGPTARPVPMPVIAPTIYAGVVKGGEQASPDQKGVFFYRLKFGSKDKVLGRVGAEKSCVSKGKEGDSGDFSLLRQLAEEIREAVQCILTRYSNAQIVLVGHGRGGLAARAFLQTSTPADEEKAVVALLTTGTPHSGTPLGRIFAYLNENPRGVPLSADWKVVDALRGVGLLRTFLIDLRRPTMSDQAPVSAALSDIQQNAKYLSSKVAYGTQGYDKVPLGKLNLLSKSIFDGFMGLPPMTAEAKNAVFLETPADQFVGDGIVPLASQTFSSEQITVTHKVNSSGRVVHSAEPAQIADIRNLLETLVTWWK